MDPLIIFSITGPNSPMTHRPPKRSFWRDLRDTLLCLGGFALLAYEALEKEVPRRDLLVVYGAMMGLGAWLYKRNGGSND